MALLNVQLTHQREIRCANCNDPLTSVAIVFRDATGICPSCATLYDQYAQSFCDGRLPSISSALPLIDANMADAFQWTTSRGLNLYTPRFPNSKPTQPESR